MAVPPGRGRPVCGADCGCPCHGPGSGHGPGPTPNRTRIPPRCAPSEPVWPRRTAYVAGCGELRERRRPVSRRGVRRGRCAEPVARGHRRPHPVSRSPVASGAGSPDRRRPRPRPGQGVGTARDFVDDAPRRRRCPDPTPLLGSRHGASGDGLPIPRGRNAVRIPRPRCLRLVPALRPPRARPECPDPGRGAAPCRPNPTMTTPKTRTEVATTTTRPLATSVAPCSPAAASTSCPRTGSDAGRPWRGPYSRPETRSATRAIQAVSASGRASSRRSAERYAA